MGLGLAAIAGLFAASAASLPPTLGLRRDEGDRADGRSAHARRADRAADEPDRADPGFAMFFSSSCSCPPTSSDAKLADFTPFASLVDYGFRSTATQAGFYLLPGAVAGFLSGPAGACSLGATGRSGRSPSGWACGGSASVHSRSCTTHPADRARDDDPRRRVPFTFAAWHADRLAVRPTETGVATGVNTVMRRFGGVIGAQVSAAILTWPTRLPGSAPARYTGSVLGRLCHSPPSSPWSSRRPRPRRVAWRWPSDRRRPAGGGGRADERLCAVPWCCSDPATSTQRLALAVVVDGCAAPRSARPHRTSDSASTRAVDALGGGRSRRACAGPAGRPRRPRRRNGGGKERRVCGARRAGGRLGRAPSRWTRPSASSSSISSRRLIAASRTSRPRERLALPAIRDLASAGCERLRQLDSRAAPGGACTPRGRRARPLDHREDSARSSTPCSRPTSNSTAHARSSSPSSTLRWSSGRSRSSTARSTSAARRRRESSSGRRRSGADRRTPITNRWQG